MTNCIIVHKLPKDLSCKKEVLGKEFDIEINGLKGKMILPKASHIPAEWEKYNEDERVFLKFDYIKGQFGRTVNFPFLDAEFDAFLFSFQHITDDDIQSVGKEINSWAERFVKLFDLLENDFLHTSEIEMSYIGDNDIYKMSNNGNFERIPNQNNEISEIIYVKSQYADETIYQTCVSATNKGLDLPFEYDHYHTALKHFSQKNYTSSIVEGAVVVEKLLDNKIVEICKTKHLPAKNLKKRYKMLSGFFELAKILNITLPTSNYKTSIIDVRNNVVHDGTKYNKKETKLFLDNVKKYLDAFGQKIFD